MNKKFLILSFIAIAAISIALMSYLSPKIWPYSTDSAGYIEAARYLKEGKGLMVSTYGVEPVNIDLASLGLWPPGYPLMIYALTLFGVNGNLAAVLVPRILFVFLPLVLFWVLRHIVGDVVAFFSAIGASFMEGVLRSTLMALSDIPFLFMTLISMGLLFKSFRKDSYGYLIAAGVTAGFALAVRNVGYALVGSVIIGLTLFPFLNLLSWRSYFKKMLFYGLGVFFSYAPVLLRNILVFHAPQPYSFPPSELPFIYVVKAYFWELTKSFLGSSYYTRLFILSFSISIVVMIILCLKRRNEIAVFKKLYWHRIMSGLIIVLYAGLGSFLIILARSRYDWGVVEIEQRHLIQYNWVFLAYFMSIIFLVVNKPVRNALKSKTQLLLMLLTICFLALQSLSLAEHLFRSKTQVVRNNKLSSISSYISELPKDTYIISNAGPDLRILTERDVRQLHDTSSEQLAAKVSPHRSLAVVLVDDLKLFERYNCLNWLSVFQGHIPVGYECELKEDDIVVLSYAKSAKQVAKEADNLDD